MPAHVTRNETPASVEPNARTLTGPKPCSSPGDMRTPRYGSGTSSPTMYTAFSPHRP